MKYILYIFTISFILFFSGKTFGQLLFVENFDYPAGDSITQHNWVGHSGATNMVVVSPGLTYTNYPSSGIGNALRLDTVGISGMDVNRNFTETTSGSIYASFMVRVLYASSTGDYYFHLGNTTLGSIFRPKLFAKDDGGSLKFGLSKASNTGTYAASSYLYNTTYLVVVKYTFVAGASNDEVSMFVFTSPNLPATEPTPPTVGPLTESVSDLENAGTVAIRQGVQSNRPVAILDGIRIAASWESIVPVINLSTTASTFALKQNYPNPFNPATNIEFSIPAASFVTLKIYDMLGREIEQLISNNLNAGWYQIKLDASDYPSGTYFYNLTVSGINESKSETKTMVLIK